MRRILVVGIAAVAIAGAGTAWSLQDNPRDPVEFYKGHSHEHGETHGAPGHSGGTDRYGCHNASVPYHCH